MSQQKGILIFFILLIMGSSVPGTLALDTYGGTALMDVRFRDDSPAMGIDHSRPNPSLAYYLNQKLYSAAMQQRVYSGEQLQQEVPAPGFPPGLPQPGLHSRGDQKLLVFLVDFPDVPHGTGQTVAAASARLNGPGDPADYPFESVHGFYSRSSYNQLNLTSDIYGWYRAKHNREYYNTSGGPAGNLAIIEEALDAYNSQVDYSRYDGNHDGLIDGIYIFYTGADNGWGNFWWYYMWDVYTPRTWDGVSPHEFAWQWYASPWSPSGSFSRARNACHEIGHLLGLPDYYDYDGRTGPDGGVGGFDMMDGNWPDHNTFSKYLLDWTQPVVLGENPSDSTEILYPAGDFKNQNAVMIMPGMNPGDWSEFYLAENRAPGYGNDPGPWTKKGLTIWHIDATIDPATKNFKYDNSYTPHKLIRLMEADGNEDIEHNRGWDQNDIYGPDQSFGPATTPGSYRYDGTDSQIHILEIETLPGDAVRARYVTGPTIPLPWVRVTVPQGGEQWQVGTPHSVTWTQNGLDSSDVRIDLWNESQGKFQHSIAVSVPAGQGMYVWNIPANITPSAGYRVTISSLRYPLVNDSSDGLLEITPVHQPAVSVKKYIARNNASWNDTSVDVYRGAKVYYKVMVKNTGDCVLTSVSFADGSSYATYSMLEPGAAWTLYYSAAAGASDYTNTAIVGAASLWGYAPSVRDSARYHLVPGPLPGFSDPPTDPDGDGIYEDLNANGRLDFADVVLFFNQMEWIAAHEPVSAFDLNGNSRIDFADIVRLFGEI